MSLSMYIFFVFLLSFFPEMGHRSLKQWGSLHLHNESEGRVDYAESFGEVKRDECGL